MDKAMLARIVYSNLRRIRKMSNALNIGNRREVFWDDYLIDTEKTTTHARVGQFSERERVGEFNKRWDIGCSDRDCFGCVLYMSAWHTHFTKQQKRGKPNA